ncbi:putative GTPase activating protein for Arf-domain-containing protein [Geopyxis carbonaria]|nr:putative GTPase activating protein for Arf-domain-containing protein [Geopyxis carbonaria]
MSRRLDPKAEKAAANQQVIKSLLKLPGNRLCADCKRNKLPRWASWNLGIFICIRCSGIHRGMGTHISKVKSVDLDSWTDEQLQSMLKWGNTRANKYWESNLATGHVPSEAKIENFVRTKYESKRWVMEGAMPDPATLDDSEDDNLPLKVVQQKLEGVQSAASKLTPITPALDLFGDDSTANNLSSPPAIPSSASGISAKQTKPADLLGLDFFGTTTQPSSRPSSITSDPGRAPSSRPDLNRSILSLYASSPRTQPTPQSPSTYTYSAPVPPQPSSTFTGLNDAFGSVNLGPHSTAQPAKPSPQPKPSPFANLTPGLKKTGVSPKLSQPMPGGFGSSNSNNKSSGTSGVFEPGNIYSAAANPSTLVAETKNQFAGDTNAWNTSATLSSSVLTSVDAWTQPTNSTKHSWDTPASTKPTPGDVDDDDWGNFSSGVPKKSVQSGGYGDEDLFGNVWKN